MEKNDVLFYIKFVKVFAEDDCVRYIIVALEDLKEPWSDDDILVLFDVSRKESDKIMTLLGKYVEIEQYGKI